MTGIDLAGTIGPRDYFHIDDHMRPRGHAKVAQRVLEALDEPGRVPAGPR